MLGERDGFGGVTARYVYGGYIDEPLLMQRDTDGDGTLDGTFYYLQDDNYNVTALADTAGNVVERYGVLPE